MRESGQSERAAGRRGPRWVLVAALAAVVAGCALVAAIAADHGPATADAPAMERLLAERLEARHLTYRYVACVPNGRTFAGQAVIRCNVNFNAPHIEVYCSVLRDGEVLTNHEDPAIPCPRDDAGQDPPVQTSS